MQIGIGLAVALISIGMTIRDIRGKLVANRARRAAAGVDGPVVDLWAVPPGRGDYPLWMALAGWFALPRSPSACAGGCCPGIRASPCVPALLRFHLLPDHLVRQRGG